MVERKMEKSMEEMDLEYIANSDLEWSKYKNKTIFVTGATGLIGSLLVKAFAYYNCLHQGNIKIIGLIRNEEKAKRIYGKWYNNYGIHLMIGDIEQIPVIAGDVDYIFHTVSITASKMMVQHPVLTIQTSYMGTKNVYGIPDEKKEYITEKDLGYIELENVRSSYSEGKRICECLCNAYAAEFGLPVKSARLAQTFGAGVLQEDNRVYAQFARSAMKKENLVLRTDGSSEGNYCYTRDVVNEKSHMTIREMAELVANDVSNGEIKVEFDIPDEAKSLGYAPKVKMHLSSEKLNKLGWKAEVDMKEAYLRMMNDMEA